MEAWQDQLKGQEGTQGNPGGSSKGVGESGQASCPGGVSRPLSPRSTTTSFSQPGKVLDLEKVKVEAFLFYEHAETSNMKYKQVYITKQPRTGA